MPEEVNDATEPKRGRPRKVEPDRRSYQARFTEQAQLVSFARIVLARAAKETDLDRALNLVEIALETLL